MSPKGAKGGHTRKKTVDKAAEIVLHVVQPEVERGALELFHTPSRVAFATLKVHNHYENLEVDGAAFKDLLCLWIFTKTGEMPSESVWKKTIRIMRGQALYGATSVQRNVFHRIAEAGGSIYLDLCDEAWRDIEITAGGWWIKENPPVRFVRSVVSRPLPVPERGGSLDGIFDFVNISSREHQVLFLSYLAGALQTHASYPILMLVGAQGSAKTTATRIATALVDPAEPQMASGYSSERDLLIDAQFSHMIAIDNISLIGDQFSDALCRLAKWAVTLDCSYGHTRICAFYNRSALLFWDLIRTAQTPDDSVADHSNLSNGMLPYVLLSTIPDRLTLRGRIEEGPGQLFRGCRLRVLRLPAHGSGDAGASARMIKEDELLHRAWVEFAIFSEHQIYVGFPIR
jgi:hypothetical protein